MVAGRNADPHDNEDSAKPLQPDHRIGRVTNPTVFVPIALPCPPFLV